MCKLKRTMITLAWFITIFTFETLAPLSSQTPHRDAPPNLDGEWTIVYMESGGDHFSTLVTEQMIAGNRNHQVLDFYTPFGWTLVSDPARVGPNGNMYKIHPDGKPGAIDLYHIENGNKGDAVRGLYRLKDGYLFIAMNFPSEDRPENFSASSPKSPKEVFILRKGFIK